MSTLWVCTGFSPYESWLRADRVTGVAVKAMYPGGWQTPESEFSVFVQHLAETPISEEEVAHELPTRQAANSLARDLLHALAVHRDDAGVLMVQGNEVRFVSHATRPPRPAAATWWPLSRLPSKT